jgi:hypothetical protein
MGAVKTRDFAVCPGAPRVQIVLVRRYLAPVLLAFLSAAPLRAGGDGLERFNVVDIKPSTTSFIIASVTMTMPPFTRKGPVYSSVYYARVFPYFFLSEKGRIWITVPDDDIRRVSLGLPVDFVGHALSESGEERKVEGHAVPTGPTAGKIRVRVFVSRRISLNYDTTYELKGGGKPVAAVTPR